MMSHVSHWSRPSCHPHHHPQHLSKKKFWSPFFYNSQIKSAPLAVDAWTMMLLRLLLIKDMSIGISKLIWNARFEANYKYEANHKISCSLSHRLLFSKVWNIFYSAFCFSLVQSRQFPLTCSHFSFQSFLWKNRVVRCFFSLLSFLRFAQNVPFAGHKVSKRSLQLDSTNVLSHRVSYPNFQRFETREMTHPKPFQLFFRIHAQFKIHRLIQFQQRSQQVSIIPAQNDKNKSINQ